MNGSPLFPERDRVPGGGRGLRWTIVVGYDGSPRSEDAVALAGDLLEAVGGRLVVACVYRRRALGGRFGSGLHGIAPAGAVAGESGAVVDLAVASSYGGLRLAGLTRGAAGRLRRACLCPVLVLQAKQAEAHEGSAEAGVEATRR